MKKCWLAASVALVALLAGAPGPALAAPATPSAAVGSVASAASVATAAPAAAAAAERKRRPFRVKKGLTVTNPLNHTRDNINAQIHAAINHTRKGATIRMMSWNFDSWPYVRALTAAHQRGVSVQLIMARTLFKAQAANKPAKVLARNLAKGNKRRPAAMRSWVRTCSHSCRGRGGAMHSKWYAFSQSGASKQVVMNTSANLTAAAGGSVQWNDMYTTVGREKIYQQYMLVFRQSKRDRRFPYLEFRDKDITGFFFPLNGARHPAMRMLNRVRCTGAVRAGVNGRTSIRAAIDVFNNEIGLRLARKLQQLHRQGCNVRVVYSQVARKIYPVIRSMPFNHLVQDRDGDGSYDRYLHSKVLTISGNYAGNPTERIVLNGSANWSGTGISSDEQGMIINRDAVEKRYSAWINEMFRIKLESAPLDPELAEDSGRRVPIDPYANMEG